MKKIFFLFLLIITLVHCIAADEENTDMPSTDMSAGDSHREKQSSSPISIQSMWAAVRQSLSNFGKHAFSIDDTKSISTPIKPIHPIEKDSHYLSNNNDNSNTATNKDISLADGTEQLVHVEAISKDEEDDNNNKENSQIQMAPIERGLVYLRPKANERWILNQEGMITWGISSYIQAKSDEIFMNCNLYLGERMIMSVFKGVPLIIGTESWTPPTFLEPSPEYRLRLWSQPSSIGIIDQYSDFFSIVPRKEDAFMFSYNRSVVFDNSNNKTTLVPTDKTKIGQNDPPAPSISEKHGVVIDVNSTPSSLNPNAPTGIYALYPSAASHKQRFSAYDTIIVSALFFLFL